MNISRTGNYRIEIKLDPRQSFTDMPHEWFVSAGAEIADNLETYLGVKPSRVSPAWDRSYQCENCDSDLDHAVDETDCWYCERLMCYGCSFGCENKPICESCWKEGKR